VAEQAGSGSEVASSLRPYQSEAVERALPLGGFGLFLEQRAGKTRTALEIVRRRNPGRLLVVCPKRAIPVWRQEILALEDPPVIEVITYEWMVIHSRALLAWAPDMVIADEAHYAKKRTSRRSKVLRKLGRVARWRLALTGTPIGQGIWDLWAVFDFLDPSYFGPWEAFEARYMILKTVKLPGRPLPFKKIVGTRNVEEFNAIMHKYSARITLDEAKGQRTKVRTARIYFDLARSKLAYDEMFRRMKVEFSTGERITAPMVITQAQKLQQICGGFLIDDEGAIHTLGREKLRALGRVLSVVQGEPFVVIVKYLQDLELVNDYLHEIGLSTTIIRGGQEFTGFDTDAAIVQIQSGIAIDLSRASTCIFYSMNHSYFNFDQARFRVRSYSTHEVRYYFLIARETVEEDIYEAVTKKKSLSQLLLERYRERN
jgi:hypothetical protein